MKHVSWWLVMLCVLMSAPAVHAQNIPYGAVVADVPGVSGCDKAVQLGVGSARVGIRWPAAQSGPNSPISWYPDALVRCLDDHHIRILMTIEGTPEWAGGGENQNILPNDLNAWQAFVRSVITHYSFEIQPALNNPIAFGIWNEPEAEGFLDCGLPVIFNGECYGDKIFRHAAIARDEANPNAILAGPEMGTLDNRYETALWYMNQWLKPQDIITVHNHNDTDGELIDYMNDAISKAGGRETWLSEIGSDAWFYDQAQEIDARAGTFAYRTNPAWTRMFVYRLAATGSDQDDAFSLYWPGGQNKPSFENYESFIKIHGQDRLLPEQVLVPRGRLVSANGEYMLQFQYTGSVSRLRLRRVNASIWEPSLWISPNVSLYPQAGRAKFQGDGNFVLYEADGTVRWASMQFNNPAFLKVQNDGNLVAYRNDCSVLWQTGTGGGSTSDCNPPAPPPTSEGGSAPASELDNLTDGATVCENHLADSAKVTIPAHSPRRSHSLLLEGINSARPRICSSWRGAVR